MVKINESTPLTMPIHFIFVKEKTFTGQSKHCVTNPDDNTYQSSSDHVNSVGKEKEEGTTLE